MNHYLLHTHDHAQRMVRRHAQDLRWAKERHVQHEREFIEAQRLLQAGPAAVARGVIVFAVIGFVLIVAGMWVAATVQLPAALTTAIDLGTSAIAVVTVVGCVIGFRRAATRRAHARAIVASHDRRATHTKYQVSRSIDSWMTARTHEQRLAELRGVSSAA